MHVALNHGNGGEDEERNCHDSLLPFSLFVERVALVDVRREIHSV